MVNEETFSVSENKDSCNLKAISRKEKTIMKKLKLLLPISLLLLTAVLLSSCGHVHDIVIDPEVAPTCVATGKTEGAHCSSCGEVIVKQKEIPMVAHNIEKTGCTTCDLKASEGLKYEEYEDDGYRVSLGTCTDKDIIISPYGPNGERVVIVNFSMDNTENITSIRFLDGFTSIAGELNSPNLVSVELPYGLLKIGHHFFSNCSSLKSVDIPDTCYRIDDCAFENCKQLESIKLPEALSVINFAVFRNCVNLKEVYISENVSVIDRFAFEDCSNLTEIHLRGYLAYIGEEAFSGCARLSIIDLSTTDTVTFNNVGKHPNWAKNLPVSCKLVFEFEEITIKTFLEKQ